MTTPLDALLVDEESIALEDLADALRPFLRLTRSGELVLEQAFDALRAEDKVVCVLLSLQALRLLGLRDSAAAKSADIVEMSGMAPGTVRPTLSALTKSRRVSRERDGGYLIAPHSAKKAAVELRGRVK